MSGEPGHREGGGGHLCVKKSDRKGESHGVQSDRAKPVAVSLHRRAQPYAIYRTQKGFNLQDFAECLVIP